MANDISKIQLPGMDSASDIRANKVAYGECGTAASTAKKAVTIFSGADGTGTSQFVLEKGSMVIVRFTVTNSAAVANLTLNVNSTGDKGIKYRNANLSSAGVLAANRTYQFIYDGTYWQLTGDLDTDSNTDTKVSQTAITTGTKPILLAYSNSNNTNVAYFDTNVTVDAATHKINAAQINLSSAPSADTEAATKKYVDDLVANATHFCGSFNASDGKINGSTTDTLTTVAEKVGDMYVCDTAGTYLSQAYEVGDSIIFRNAVAAGTAPDAADIISVEKTVSVTQSLTSGTKIGTVEGVDLYCQTNTDSYRAIQVNGTDKLGTATSTGKINFANGTNTTVVFTAASGTTPAKIQINATDTNTAQATGTKSFVTASDFSFSAGTAPALTTSTWNLYTVTSSTTTATKTTLGTAIAADDITSWSAGTLPTLSTSNISADDITSWDPGTLPAATLSDETLVLAVGTLPSLSYTARSIPNVTGVGTLPSLSYTARSIPNVTGNTNVTVPILSSTTATAVKGVNTWSAGTVPTLTWSSASAVTGVST